MKQSRPEGDLQSPSSPAAGAPLAAAPRFSISPETWIALGILVLTLAAYLQVMGFHFVTFDDPLYITANPTIQEGMNWKSFRYAFAAREDGSFLPLVWLSHALCVSLFGTWAGGHHLVNLLFHAANSLLLFYFLKKITRSMWPSAAVAILFAIHPLHVESVAWVSGRKDVMSTLFWILTSWAYVHYAERPSLRRYLGMTLLFILGLLSKSMLVTLPLTLLLLDVWPLRRIDWTGASMAARVKALWPLVAEKLPLLALSVGTALITLGINRSVGTMVALNVLPVQHRLANALLTLVKYLQQTFWPWNLSAFYPYTTLSFPVWKVAGALTFLLLVSGACLYNLRRRPYLAVGWLWYLVTLLPVIGVIQVGSQAHADRYTYVSLIGIFVMLCWLAEEFVVRWRITRRWILVTSASLLGILLTLTVAQAVVWRDNLTLFKNAYSLDTDNPVALMNIGDEFLNRNQFQDAYAAYAKALKFSPGLYLTHCKMGSALQEMGRPAEALRYFQNAKRLRPDLLTVDQRIGQTLTRMGRFEEAEPYVQRVMKAAESAWSISDPVDFQASQIDWAVILTSRNRLPEAVQVLEGLLAKHPKYREARMALGLTFFHMGRMEEARVQMEMVREMRPKDPGVLYYLGVVLTRLNRFSEARNTFDQMKVVAPLSPMLQQGVLTLDKAQLLAEQSAAQGKP